MPFVVRADAYYFEGCVYWGKRVPLLRRRPCLRVSAPSRCRCADAQSHPKNSGRDAADTRSRDGRATFWCVSPAFV